MLVQFICNLISRDGVVVFVQLPVSVTQPVPRDGLVLVAVKQVDAFLIERDGLAELSLLRMGQPQIAVRPGKRWVEFDRLVVGINGIIETAGSGKDMAKLIPDMCVLQIDLAHAGRAFCRRGALNSNGLLRRFGAGDSRSFSGSFFRNLSASLCWGRMSMIRDGVFDNDLLFKDGNGFSLRADGFRDNLCGGGHNFFFGHLRNESAFRTD